MPDAPHKHSVSALPCCKKGASLARIHIAPQGETGDYVPGTGLPTCNDPRLTAGRTLVPGGVVVASLGDGGIPVVTTPPAPLPVAPPILEAPAAAPGARASQRRYALAFACALMCLPY